MSSEADALSFSVDRILGRKSGGEENRSPSREKGVEDALPAWIYCSRFSARPTPGPRRRPRLPTSKEDRRCRTTFTGHQVARLLAEFQQNEYLSEASDLAQDLGLTEAQVKIWFQNARARRRKDCGRRHPLAQRLAEAGLYNHAPEKTASP